MIPSSGSMPSLRIMLCSHRNIVTIYISLFKRSSWNVVALFGRPQTLFPHAEAGEWASGGKSAMQPREDDESPIATYTDLRKMILEMNEMSMQRKIGQREYYQDPLKA